MYIRLLFRLDTTFGQNARRQVANFVQADTRENMDMGRTITSEPRAGFHAPSSSGAKRSTSKENIHVHNLTF
jgi:hypothetical protein